MKRSIKKALLVIALALLAGFVCIVCIVWFVSRPDQSNLAEGDLVLDTSEGPAFEVRVIMPRLGLPLGGILPDVLVKKLDGTPRELRFNHISPGARIGRVAPDRLELKADGWDFLIETDAEGRVGPETRLVFPLALGGRHLRLNCRPAAPANGYLITRPRAGSDELGGRFVVELANCKNAESGKTSNWPPAPLTVRGSFLGYVTPGSPDAGSDGTKVKVSASPDSNSK